MVTKASRKPAPRPEAPRPAHCAVRYERQPRPSGRRRYRQGCRRILFSESVSPGLEHEEPMLIDGKHRRSIWLEADGVSVGIIDQTKIPHAFATLRLATLVDAAHAISSMQTRGAPLIGAVAAYGMCLALQEDTSDEGID